LAYSLNKGLSLKPQGLKDDFLNEHSFKWILYKIKGKFKKNFTVNNWNRFFLQNSYQIQQGNFF
jgi:hypothetical protein